MFMYIIEPEMLRILNPCRPPRDQKHVKEKHNSENKLMFFVCLGNSGMLGGHKGVLRGQKLSHL